jgi:hypothetical protein
MLQKPGEQDKKAESEITAIGRRKNSFEVARHRVSRSKTISKYLRKMPCVATIVRKKGGRIETVTRYYRGSEPIMIDSKLPLCY